MLADERDHARGSTAGPSAGGRSALEAGPDLHGHQAAVLLLVRDRRARAASTGRTPCARAGCASTRRSSRGCSTTRTRDPRDAERADDPAAAIVSVEPGTGAIRADDRGDPGQHAQPVQPRRAVGAPGGLDVQDVRARRGDREGHRSRHDLLHLGAVHLHDRAVVRGRLQGRQAVDGEHLRPQLRRHDLGHERDAALGQHGLRAAHARRRARLRLADGQAPRRQPDAEAGRVDRSRLARRSRRSTWPPPTRRSRPAASTRSRPAIRKVDPAERKVDKTAGWGKPQTKRALSQGVAWKVNQVLGQNALYGTGSGSGDGVHPNAGKTGTTEDHADAWFVGYTRDFSTAVWMGYPRGEIPMLDVHGQAVAGATFPVPIWHLYMAAAEWQQPARAVPRADHEIRTRRFEPFTAATGGYIPPSTTARRPTTTATDHDRRPRRRQPARRRRTTEPSRPRSRRSAGAADAPGAAAAGSTKGRSAAPCDELLTIDEALELVLDARAAARGRGRARSTEAAGRVLAAAARCGGRSAAVSGLGDGRLRAPRRGRARRRCRSWRAIAAGRPAAGALAAGRGDGDLDRRRRSRRRRRRRPDRGRRGARRTPSSSRAWSSRRERPAARRRPARRRHRGRGRHAARPGACSARSRRPASRRSAARRRSTRRPRR